MKSAQIVTALMEIFREQNLMSSPQAGHTFIRKSERNRKTENFTFGVVRTLDGVVSVYHSAFIVIKYQSGSYPQTTTFTSMEAVVDFVNKREWWG